jgi:hypothetical protein
MHHPTRITSTRSDGSIGFYVICSDCAQTGQGRFATINAVGQSGVLHGPVSELLADALIEAHRESVTTGE